MQELAFFFHALGVSPSECTFACQAMKSEINVTPHAFRKVSYQFSGTSLCDGWKIALQTPAKRPDSGSSREFRSWIQ